jgi:hypothetical protein
MVGGARQASHVNTLGVEATRRICVAFIKAGRIIACF